MPVGRMASEPDRRQSAVGSRDGTENDPRVVSAVDEQELVSAQKSFCSSRAQKSSCPFRAQKTSAEVFPGAEASCIPADLRTGYPAIRLSGQPVFFDGISAVSKNLSMDNMIHVHKT